MLFIRCNYQISFIDWPFEAMNIAQTNSNLTVTRIWYESSDREVNSLATKAGHGFGCSYL